MLNSTSSLQRHPSSTLNDLCRFSLGIFLSFDLIFWLYNGFLIYIELVDHPSLDQYRIQQHKPKLRFQPAIVRKMIHEIIKEQISLLVTIPAMYFVLNGLGHVEIQGPCPQWTTMIWQIVLFIVVADTWSYWTHRLLHIRWFYVRFHKAHHEYKQPTGIASVLTHPIESFFQNQMSLWLVPILLPETHLVTLSIWTAIRAYLTVNEHAGYDLPYVGLQYWAPWLMSGARLHDYHHEQGKWNYGTIFSLWDRLMGTHRPNNKNSHSSVLSSDYLKSK